MTRTTILAGILAGVVCAVVGLLPAAGLAAPASARPRQVLAVCADPSNLPYSDKNLRGFENQIAALLARDLKEDLHYTWSIQRRSFLRKTLRAGLCDVVIAVPATLQNLAVTRPYFVSSYVAVTRRAATHHPVWFDDPYLKTARIGLQLVGADNANTPPAMSLGRRGFVDHVTGFPMWAEDGVDSPQGRIVDAVAKGTIDVALVWGPFAGYFAKPYGSQLRIEPVTSDPKMPSLPFTYAMSMGVRADDTVLRDRLQAAIDRNKAAIGAILRRFGVPILAQTQTIVTAEQEKADAR